MPVLGALLFGGPAAPPAPALALAAPPARDAPAEVVAQLGDYWIGLEGATVPSGPVRFAVANAGRHRHNLRVRSGDAEAGTAELHPGEGATLDFNFDTPGTYAVFCDVAYHQQKGMVALVVVTAGPAPAALTPT